MMLSLNNIKLINFVKYSAWKLCIDNTYCHLRTYHYRYKLIQTFFYSTKCNTKEDGIQSSLDPRVVALREKLIYCDYLDYHKVKISYMKRFVWKKKAENFAKEVRNNELTNVPVYSVLLDEKNEENDEQKYINAEEDTTKPIHMPYASTDSYNNVDISSEMNENNFDENTISLNSRYKILYEKYLTEKNANLEKEKFNLQEYLGERDMYKKDLPSNVPFNWMVDVEQYDDTLQDNTWLSNYGTPDPNSSISSIPCGGCGALLHYFPCSIWPEINSVLHPLTPVFVVGNKVDLLPQDSKHFFTHVKDCLLKAMEITKIKKENIRHVELISAKTGYGIEELINKLHNIWKYKGDVYIIGCTNVGKSSLFNALLQSDYCKVQAVDLIQRATISPWPGTTLNLLKFPILNPKRKRLYLRALRLKMEQQHKYAEEKSRISQFEMTRNLKYATLQNRIGRTFQSTSKNYSFMEEKFKNTQFGFDENKKEYKLSRWCYDTPGTIQPNQILDLLTTQELLSVLSKKIISPRTFILRVNQTIFLGGIGRLDYVEGDTFIRCTIFSSSELPITLTHTEDADNVYNELLKTEAFVVPENNPDRLKHWPSLVSKEMEITGVGRNKSISDIVLSSAGWIAIAAEKAERVLLKAWNPQGRGLYLRTPALLRKSVTLHGNRISDTPTYKSGRQAYRK
ncbi:PREDICTED: nitric oxide-associated protein 1 isoform X2 [Atta colombica]|uniref:nitric oxide-associated protein 1 isoform X2 n=1 Tax=Atta colombica TaxID=520822 RepID=UPI00084C8D0C|nr:PREDICTED: nitric oxide-associated protein 1 isoform X2 [Atta colombica]